MSEIRARAARHKGQLNFEVDIRNFLYAFGDDFSPLPETVRILDELVTDFIIETCHSAARAAMYSNRQKIKVDDFKFAIRQNENMLGRVQQLLSMEIEIKNTRRQHFQDVDAGKVGLERAGKIAEDGEGAEEGVDGDAQGGRPKKRRKRRAGGGNVVEVLED